MSSDFDRKAPLGQGCALLTLVAAVACALTNDASARPLAPQPGVDARPLSTRVATIVERMRLADPTLVGNLPADVTVAQWGNFRR